jgi:hypothetical protein
VGGNRQFTRDFPASLIARAKQTKALAARLMRPILRLPRHSSPALPGVNQPTVTCVLV